MARPDDRSINGAVDRHGIHEIRGPLLVGGVGFLTPSTALFRDLHVRSKLSSKQRFEAYMQFREQAFKIFATELVSASKSPACVYITLIANTGADLALLTKQDGEIFRNNYWFGNIMFHYNSPHFVVDDPSKESVVENNSTTSVTAGDQSRFIYDYKKDRESMLQTYYYTRRYYAYRKGLLKLDISQLNKDPKKAVEWLKSSTGWSGLLNEELRRGLKSHMDLLKGLDMSNINQGFTSESQNVALERINVEMASTLEKKIKSFDLTLRMNHYYTRTSLRNLARVCSIQAQETEVVLVKQALPVRDICKEQILSTGPEAVMSASLRQTVKQTLEGFMKQTMKQSAKGYMGSLRWIRDKLGRGGAPRMAWLSIIPFAMFATAGMPNKR